MVASPQREPNGPSEAQSRDTLPFMPIPNQIVLEWTVDVTNTVFGPAQAAAALAAVPLYANAVTDPVLGQLFGLTKASDVVSTGATTATRTLTLNMTTGGGVPVAPPPFPCHPRTSTPPVLPYPLRKTITLPGSFFPSLGSTVVPTTMTQIPSLVTGESIQFLSQVGVFYTVAAGTTATQINLTTPYTGTTKETGAFKEIAAPVTLAAIYSTSDCDTAGVATVPAIPAGSGAQIVELLYNDSTGAGPFVAVVNLTGRRPAAVTLDPTSVDIAEIVQMVLGAVGTFGNSVGQITLVELSSALPAIPPDATPGTGVGAGQGDKTFFALTDAAQLLIEAPIAYLPPSYFALAAQQAASPQLDGDFSVTTGSTNVPTTIDQTSALSAGNIIQFVAQPKVLYTVAAVTDEIVTLTSPYTGLDQNFTGAHNVNSNAGTKGNLGTEVINKKTAASLFSPAPGGPPSNAQLSGPLGQFVALETVGPGGTVPTPTFLSGFYTRTIQLALAGVPVVSATITFV